MTEVRNVNMQQVDERCPKCGKGWMRDTGIVLTSNPPKFPHKCTFMRLCRNVWCKISLYNTSVIEKKKLRPCDCNSFAEEQLLNEVGISHNDEGITLDQGRILLKMGHTTVVISSRRFKMMAEWYLAEQDIE